MDIILIIASIISIVGTLIPRSGSKHWIIRGQANFRAVYFILNLILLILVINMLPFTVLKIFLGIFLALSVLVSLQSIAPYTKLFPKSIKDAKTDKGELLKIFIHNIYQPNNNFDAEIQLIHEEDPDIILLIETNNKWDEATEVLREQYPFEIKEIQKDTYGLKLLSKIGFKEANIKNLFSETIPSIDVLITIAGEQIRILGIHPEPPIPGEVLSSKPKDKEILNAASYINNLPKDEIKILIGDFNDVAWSSVSKKFKERTALNDVRVGRGFFSTFPSYSPLKIPLDHVFCSPELRVVEFKTLDALGSDHLPVSVTFQIPSFEQIEKGNLIPVEKASSINLQLPT